MKKIIIPMLTLCLMVAGIAKAQTQDTDLSTLDNVIYMAPNTTVTIGKESTLSFWMKNTAEIRGFELTLYLPDGVTAVKSERTGKIQGSLSEGRLPEEDEHTLSFSEHDDDGEYIRVLCGSEFEETFTGNDGEIATLQVNVADDVTPGTYPVVLKYMKLTENDIRIFYEHENIVTMLTVAEPGDDRIEFDEDTDNANALAETGLHNVRVKRTINANEWSTICLPFAMTEEQIAAAFGDDVQLADFTGYDVIEESGNIIGITVNFDEVTAIEANHPYIIKVSTAVTEFTVDGVDIAPAAPCVSFGYETGRRPVVYHPMDFIGTYTADFDFFTDAQSGHAIFLSGGKFWYATANTLHMKAFRAYFDFDDILTSVEDASGAIEFKFNLDDATGIETIGHSSLISDHYYNTAGQRVGKNYKGIVVTKGKKALR